MSRLNLPNPAAVERDSLQGSSMDGAVQSPSGIGRINTLSRTSPKQLCSIGKRLPMGIGAALTHGLSNTTLDPLSNSTSHTVPDAGVYSSTSTAMHSNDAAESSNSVEDSDGSEAEPAAATFLTIPGVSNLSPVPILGSALQYFSLALGLGASDTAALFSQTSTDASVPIPGSTNQSSSAVPGSVTEPNSGDIKSGLTDDDDCHSVEDADSPKAHKGTSLQGNKVRKVMPS